MKYSIAPFVCAAFLACAAPASAGLATTQPTATAQRDVVHVAQVLPGSYNVRRRVGLPQGKVKERPLARVPVVKKKILIR